MKYKMDYSIFDILSGNNVIEFIAENDKLNLDEDQRKAIFEEIEKVVFSIGDLEPDNFTIFSSVEEIELLFEKMSVKNINSFRNVGYKESSFEFESEKFTRQMIWTSQEVILFLLEQVYGLLELTLLNKSFPTNIVKWFFEM